VRIGTLDIDLLKRLFQALRDEEAEYLVVGGVAMNLHGFVRATDDVDLFVRPTAENIRRVRAALHRVWEDPSIEEIRAEDLAGEYPVVRYGPPEVEMVVDLMSRLGERFQYEDLEGEWHDLEGTPVHVATPRTLYRMKRDTVREDDRRDAARLREHFDLGEA
jgi:hypothetical protein